MTKYALYQCATVENPVVVFKDRSGYWDPASYFYGFGSRIKVDVDKYNEQILGLDKSEVDQIFLSSFKSTGLKPRDEEVMAFIKQFQDEGFKCAKLEREAS